MDPAPTCRLAIKVTTGASRDEIVGPHGDAIRVRLRAPPVEGRANAALLAFLAGLLDLRPSALRLVAGASSRLKIVAISGLAADEARRRILEHA